jgi:hypothetical protein
MTQNVMEYYHSNDVECNAKIEAKALGQGICRVPWKGIWGYAIPNCRKHPSSVLILEMC